jgi:hypothetical protein
MKVMKNLALLLFFIAYMNVYAQKEDYIWLLGAPPNIPEQNSGGTVIDFHVAPPAISFFDIPLDFAGISMISNGGGTLQFYSNGCLVMTAQHELMENGDGINEGPIANYYCDDLGLGYPCGNCVLAMPMPGETSKYILLHRRADNSTLSKDFLFTRIDMSKNNGLGAVTSKNEVVLQDTFSGFLTAVRHGNGRDWWVMLHKNRSNRSLCYLLDPAGLHDPIIQHLGQKWNYQDWAGQSVFSPDGSKYARANPYNGLTIFDFDRCSGTLSNPLVIGLAADSASACGVAFSLNSRFLYLSTGTKLFQFDMQAADIAASKQLIGVYDGFLAPFPTTFYQQRLAPDGKIYMSATNGVNFFHVINNPNEPGIECDFIQHGIQLKSYHSFNAPNFPYFRLYDLPGSPCDTLGINGGPVSAGEHVGAEKTFAFTVSPNPASEQLSIQTTNGEPAQQDFQITLSNPLGQIIHRELLPKGASAHQMNLRSLPGGLYLLTVSQPSGYGQTFRVFIHQN